MFRTILRTILNLLKFNTQHALLENRDQHSTSMIHRMLNFFFPTHYKMNYESIEQQKEAQCWRELPLSMKIHIASFLDRREVTALSQINREENNNKINFICASLDRNPDQIQQNDDLTLFIAQLLKLKFKDISHSERFETLMIQFIQKLEPQQTPFLTSGLEVTGHAHYGVVNDRIYFQYKKLNKNENMVIANLLEQYFPGIKSRVVQLQTNEPYRISFDKTVFLQNILPWLFQKTGKPQKHSQIHKPEVIDYTPPDPSKTKRYFLVRNDGKPLTEEDKVKIEHAYYRRRL